MSTLPPLVESSSSARARLLLRAARADGPGPSAASRTLRALGVVGTTAKVALAAGGAAAPAGAIVTGAGASSLAMIAAKWVLVGMLGGTALASGAALVFSEEPAAPAAPPISTVTAAPANAAPAAAAAAEQNLDGSTAAPAPATSATPKSPRASANLLSSASSPTETAPVAAPSQAAFESPEQSRLLHDIALLDDARRALRSGNATQAKAALQRYENERLSHVLDREAQLLRIDVLTALGERAQARQLAAQYVTTFPNDAHVERLRALLEGRK